jgi:hypothetical protein
MPPLPGEEPGADAADPGTANVKGSPDDAVTRGQADVVMDIAERAIAAVGKGKTQKQQQQLSEIEADKKRNEAEAAGVNPGGGPMGELGGAMDPSMFNGPLGKAAREMFVELGYAK